MYGQTSERILEDAQVELQRCSYVRPCIEDATKALEELNQTGDGSGRVMEVRRSFNNNPRGPESGTVPNTLGFQPKAAEVSGRGG